MRSVPAAACCAAGASGLNVLFVGRVAPHKRQEDLIRVFCHLKRAVRPDSRLLLVGSTRGMERYVESLHGLVRKAGPVRRRVRRARQRRRVGGLLIAARRSISSMSEHEGFGVPLLEAMHFGVPVVAYKAAAVPETLGGAGLLLTARNDAGTAELIALLDEDRELRERVVARQRERAAGLLCRIAFESAWRSSCWTLGSPAMRMLYVTHQYPPAIGGSEKYVGDLSQELAARGHQVDVFTSRSRDYHTWKNELGPREQRERGGRLSLSQPAARLACLAHPGLEPAAILAHAGLAFTSRSCCLGRGADLSGDVCRAAGPAARL